MKRTRRKKRSKGMVFEMKHCRTVGLYYSSDADVSMICTPFIVKCVMSFETYKD